MNLTSCDECGILIDKDKLNFPHDLYKEDGDVDTEKATWCDSTHDYIAYLPCPVCQCAILEN